MNNLPLISIIIPTYNRASLIAETLTSIKNQTYTNWECIIVDDGSSDNTDEVVKDFITNDNRFQYHKRPNQYKPGGNGARNYGFDLSKGEYINWFDSDDLMLEDFLLTKVNAICDDIFFVICSGSYWYPESKKIVPLDITIKKDLYIEYVLWEAKILTPSILFKRSFLESQDLYSEKIIRGQEAELFSRLFFEVNKNHYKIINKDLFFYRQHENTKSKLEKEPYNKGLKESRYIISLNNYHRCKEIEEYIDITKRSVSTIFYLYFESIRFKDFELTQKIMEEFVGSLKNNYKNLRREIVWTGKALIFSRKMGVKFRGTSYLKNRWIKILTENN